MADEQQNQPEVCKDCGTPLVFDTEQKDWYCPECDTEPVTEGQDAVNGQGENDSPVLEDELKEYCYSAFDEDAQVDELVKELQTLGVYKDEELKYPIHPTVIARKVSAHYRHWKELHGLSEPKKEPTPAPAAAPAPAPAQAPVPDIQTQQPVLIPSVKELMLAANKPKSTLYWEQAQEYARQGNRELAETCILAGNRMFEAEMSNVQKAGTPTSGSGQDFKDKIVEKVLMKAIEGDPFEKWEKMEDRVAKRFEKYGGGGDSNPETETLRIIASEIKGTREDLVDTVREVTGSGGRFNRKRNRDEKKQYRYSCPKCQADVSTDAKRCPECGVVFEGVEHADGTEEVFDKDLPKKPRMSAEEKIKAAATGEHPPIPKAVAAQLDNLYRIANWIDAKHDPVQKARFLWGVANEKEKRAALFSATVLGKERMLKLSEPYRRHPDIRAAIKDIDDIWNVVTSLEGSTFLDKFLGEMKTLAKDEGVVLTDMQIEWFKQQLRPAIEYRRRMLGGQPTKPAIPPNAVIPCPVCNRPIPAAKYQEHIKLHLAPTKAQAPPPLRQVTPPAQPVAPEPEEVIPPIG